MKTRSIIRYVIAGAIAGAIVTGTALAHDSSDHDEATDPGGVVPALEQNVDSVYVPIAAHEGGVITDAEGRVALVTRAGIDTVIAEVGAEGGGERDPRDPKAVATFRIADYFDRLVAAGAVEWVAPDDPRLLEYCTVDAVAADRCTP